jgi:hypothetical protein
MQSRPGCLWHPSRARVERKAAEWSAPTALWILLTATAAILLLRFPPEQYGFYPECPVHHFFGILCPGCGTTRALAALLRGHIAEALRFNPLTTVLLPVSFGWAFFKRRGQWSALSPAALGSLLTAAVLFTLARNL